MISLSSQKLAQKSRNDDAMVQSSRPLAGCLENKFDLLVALPQRMRELGHRNISN